MKRDSATSIFESLSSGTRLDVFRLLVKRGPEGMVAGEIASTLEVPPTNLSFHLKALTQAQLISVEQEGRFLRYRANIPLMLDLIAYLPRNAAPAIRSSAQGCARLQAAVRLCCRRLRAWRRKSRSHEPVLSRPFFIFLSLCAPILPRQWW